MSSSRAQSVAEVLYELKQAEKLGTLTRVAKRSGFSPGVNGKTILNVLESVRREWPHLQWWRVIRDDGTILNKEQADHLQSIGVETTEDSKRKASVLVDETLIMIWETADDAKPSLKPVPTP